MSRFIKVERMEMKKTIFALLAAFALFFSACDSNKTDEQNSAAQSDSMPSDSAQNAQSGQISITKGDDSTAQQDYWVKYDINGNKIINFSPNDAQQDATTKAIGAVALARTPLQTINKALLRGQLSKNFILKCSSCHDDYANGIIGPSLLNKTSDEIYTMISAYKDRSKKNVLMSDLVKMMDENEIRAFAKEISEFNAQFRGQL